MNKLTLNRFTNYLMFATLCLFTAGCLYLFSIMLISRLQGDTPSPAIPWTTLQIGFVLIVIPFFAKRIFAKVVDAPEDVELPRNAAFFVGFLQGLLYGGTILIFAGAGLFCFAPTRLFDHNISYYALAVLGATGAAGIFYAPLRVARKARLWLLLALIAQFVTLSTLRQLLGLAPLSFDYTVQLPDPGKMPLAGKDVVNLLVPDDAENIHIYGTRGVETRVQCKVDGKGLEKFAQKHKFELPENTGKEFVFGNNEFVIFIYDPSTQLLTGYFKRDGLPEKLRRPEKAVSDSK